MKQALTITFALLLLTGLTSAAGLCGIGDAYGGSYINFTAPSSSAPGTTFIDISKTQANFTALQNLTRVHVAYVNASGVQNFTSPYGYHFEFINETTGKARLWIRVPYLDASGAAIQLCYSQSSVVGNDNETAVFETEFGNGGVYLFDQMVNATVAGHNSAGPENAIWNTTGARIITNSEGNKVLAPYVDYFEGAYYPNFSFVRPINLSNVAAIQTNLAYGGKTNTTGNKTNWLAFSIQRPYYDIVSIADTQNFNYTPYYTQFNQDLLTTFGGNNSGAANAMVVSTNFNDVIYENYTALGCHVLINTTSGLGYVYTDNNNGTYLEKTKHLPFNYNLNYSARYVSGCAYDGQTADGTAKFLFTDGTMPVINATVTGNTSGQMDLKTITLSGTGALSSSYYQIGGKYHPGGGTYGQMNGTIEAVFLSQSPPKYAYENAWLDNFKGAQVGTSSNITLSAMPQVTYTLNVNESTWSDAMDFGEGQAIVTSGALSHAVINVDGVNYTLNDSIGQATFTGTLTLNASQASAGYHTINFCANSTTGETNCTDYYVLNISKLDPCLILSVNSSNSDITSNTVHHDWLNISNGDQVNVSSYMSCSVSGLAMSNVTMYLNGTLVTSGLNGPNDPIGISQSVLYDYRTYTAPAGQNQTYLWQIRFAGDNNLTELPTDDACNLLGTCSCTDDTCQRLYINVQGAPTPGNNGTIVPVYTGGDAGNGIFNLIGGFLDGFDQASNDAIGTFLILTVIIGLAGGAVLGLRYLMPQTP